MIFTGLRQATAVIFEPKEGGRVFIADPKTLQRIERHIQRVLVVDPHQQAAKLVLDLMKDCGSRDVLLASTRERAW